MEVGNCKIKGNALELFTTSVSKIPIRRIDFAKPKDVAIHDLLAGDYSVEEKKGYKYNSTSNTWIKEKGIVDEKLERKKFKSKNGFLITHLKYPYLLLYTKKINKRERTDVSFQFQFQLF
jgi:hypothetical protein